MRARRLKRKKAKEAFIRKAQEQAEEALGEEYEVEAPPDLGGMKKNELLAFCDEINVIYHDKMSRHELIQLILESGKQTEGVLDEVDLSEAHGDEGISEVKEIDESTIIEEETEEKEEES